MQPADVPEEIAAVEMFYATLQYSDKAIMLPTGFKREMELILEASAELFGGKEAMIEKPRMIALINTVSPLTLDERMLDCLMLLAEYGQPPILCPASMLGATSSISMAGTIASGTAESLGRYCHRPDDPSGNSGGVWNPVHGCRHERRNHLCLRRSRRRGHAGLFH